MKQTRRFLPEALLFLGVVVLVAAGLPLLGLAAFATRAVLVTAAAAAVVTGVVLYAVSPALRGWLMAQTEDEITYNGLRLAHGVALHPAHSWARFEGDEVTAGADDLVQATLGPVETVDLPPAGRRVAAGEPLFSLHRGRRRVDVLSPVAGTVTRANPALREHPELVNREPFAAGWAVRLGGVARRQRRLLERGNSARAWFRREVDRVLATVFAGQARAPSLPDGGVLVGKLHHHVDDEAWRRLSEGFFGGTAPAPETPS